MHCGKLSGWRETDSQKQESPHGVGFLGCFVDCLRQRPASFELGCKVPVFAGLCRFGIG